MIRNFVIWTNFCIIFWVKLAIMHFSYFRTLSFDDSNPRAARKGRKPLKPIPKDSLQKSLLDPEDSRRRSWHSEEISTYFLDFGISSKGKNHSCSPHCDHFHSSYCQKKCHKIIWEISFLV